jgi:hypothetical protein
LGFSLIETCRDGKTPEAVTEQILAIAPILPGQKRSGSFEIPPHKQKQPQPAPPAPANGGMNLIDFDDPPLPPPKEVSDLKRGLMDEPEPFHSAGGTPPGLQAPLIPQSGYPIKRQDTNSGEVDEFVDAEET